MQFQVRKSHWVVHFKEDKKMNRCLHIGRLTADPKITYYNDNGEQKAIAAYTLAVDRKTRDKKADFLNFKAFGKNADFASNYLKKGTKIAVESHVQTGNYTDKEGRKVYTTDFVVDSQEFCESKSNSTGGNTYPSDDLPTMGGGDIPNDMPRPSAPTDDFMSIPTDVNEDLPFRS